MAEQIVKTATKPHGHKALIIILIVVAVLLTAYIVACNLLVDYALKPHTRSTENTPEDSAMYAAMLEQLGDSYAESVARTEQWSAETAAEAVSTVSDDGLRLAGTVYRQEDASHLWAKCVHGYNSRGADMAGFARQYHERGYNVLTPDLRAHGNSEGDYITMGWPDRLDMLKWINMILAEDADAVIVLHGISMGGATVMMTSGEALPENVIAIIDDCGYTSVWDIFAGQMKERFRLPAFPLLNGAGLMSRIRAGYGFREASALEQVKKSVTPIFFIHGDADDFVPTRMVYELYGAATCEKELLVVEGAGHGMSANVAPEEYWTRVFEFIAAHAG